MLGTQHRSQLSQGASACGLSAACCCTMAWLCVYVCVCVRVCVCACPCSRICCKWCLEPSLSELAFSPQPQPIWVISLPALSLVGVRGAWCAQGSRRPARLGKLRRAPRHGVWPRDQRCLGDARSRDHNSTDPQRTDGESQSPCDPPTTLGGCGPAYPQRVECAAVRGRSSSCRGTTERIRRLPSTRKHPAYPQRVESAAARDRSSSCRGTTERIRRLPIAHGGSAAMVAAGRFRPISSPDETIGCQVSLL
jgi:hypothetical protein